MLNLCSKRKRRMFIGAVFLMELTLVNVARAQALVAGESEQERPPVHHREERWMTSGIRFSGGAAFSPGHATGFYGRVDYGEIGPGVGLNVLGLEGWRAKDGWGLGIPSSFYVWYPIRLGDGDTPALMISAAAGISWATFDRLSEKNHFGIFTPQGSISFGLMLKRVRLLADGQAEYRWHFTGDHRPQFRAGLSLAINLE